MNNHYSPLPQRSDYVIKKCGRYGADTCVGIVGGGILGEFYDKKFALTAIKYDMEKKDRKSNIWELDLKMIDNLDDDGL